tara:strand:+ start:1540 stop:1851 length:312 start_codon:yes stop_codon:yes gene_type:complete
MRGQKRNVLDHLRVRPITQDEAKNLYGIARLASRIQELRKEGYRITTKWLEKNGARFAEYHLSFGYCADKKCWIDRSRWKKYETPRGLKVKCKCGRVIGYERG